MVDTVDTPSHVRIESCEAVAMDEPPTGWGRAVALAIEAWDEVLNKEGMPRMSSKADGYTVVVATRLPPDANGRVLAGQFNDFLGEVRLWPKTLVDDMPGRALPHELMHLYDFEEFGVNLVAWNNMQREVPPRHFKLGAIGQDLVDRAKHRWDVARLSD